MVMTTRRSCSIVPGYLRTTTTTTPRSTLGSARRRWVCSHCCILLLLLFLTDAVNHERALCGALAPFMGQDDEYDAAFDAWVAAQVVRLRYRFALLFVHFTPGLLRDSVRLFLKRQTMRPNPIRRPSTTLSTTRLSRC